MTEQSTWTRGWKRGAPRAAVGPAPAVHVQGTTVVAANGRAVRLRGVQFRTRFGT